MTRIVSRPHTIEPPQLSYEQFLAQYSGGEHVEWVDGEVKEMAAVTVDHAGIQGFLYTLMKVLAEQRDLGQVLSDPFQMKTGTDLPGRAPDILFVKRNHLKRLHKLYLEGPADLVIEIISPTSRTTDRVHKFREYETGGVPEYWVIDPDFERADFFQLARTKRYEPLVVKNGIVRSRAMKGLWIKTDWLWSPPPLLVALKELKII